MMKEKMKSNKGSVTTIVLVTVLFFLIILSTAYMVTATLRKNQLKRQLVVKQVYANEIDMD